MAFEIHKSTPRKEECGGGIVFEFRITSADDVKTLPKPGDWAALTSTALNVITTESYTLMKTGWLKMKQGNGESGDNNGYNPPAGGIPKEDLSQEVRGLLAKAESALQQGSVLHCIQWIIKIQRNPF